MNTILLLLAAVLPAIVISIYFYFWDKNEREPLLYILISFGFGAFSTYPALKMEEFGIYDLAIYQSSDFLMTFTFAFLVIAFSEELVKYIFLRYFLFNRKEFSEPLDGIIYSVTISMGFAAMENILHIVFWSKSFVIGIEVAYYRMFSAVPAHAAFGMVMGFFTGLAKFNPKRETLYLVCALGAAIFLHGLYNFLIFLQMSELLMVFTLITIFISLVVGKCILKVQRDISIKRLSDDKY